jgi:hypothetical protein
MKESYMKQFEELGKQFTPEERAEIERQWPELIAEVRANHDLDPGSPKAQELAKRWSVLVQATFRGNRAVAAAVAEGYREGRYSYIEGTPSREDFAFIDRANAARPSSD